jgi:hypothetical protein
VCQLAQTTASAHSEHPDRTPVFTPTARTPQWGHPVGEEEETQRPRFQKPETPRRQKPPKPRRHKKLIKKPKTNTSCRREKKKKRKNKYMGTDENMERKKGSRAAGIGKGSAPK